MSTKSSTSTPKPVAAVAAAAAKQASTDTTSAAALTDLPADPLSSAEEKAGTRRADGGGTFQREPKPEDYPASAKVTPPAEQLNSALSQVVGHAAPPLQANGAISDQISEAAETAEDEITASRERTEAEFERRAAVADDERKG